jgi:hypothetical protein
MTDKEKLKRLKRTELSLMQEIEEIEKFLKVKRRSIKALEKKINEQL